MSVEQTCEHLVENLQIWMAHKMAAVVSYAFLEIFFSLSLSNFNAFLGASFLPALRLISSYFFPNFSLGLKYYTGV